MIKYERYQSNTKEIFYTFKEMILLVVALLDVVADFFFTDSGNVSPCAVPVVEAVDILSGLGSSSGRSSVLETSGFSGGEESEEDEQADEKGLHFFCDCYCCGCFDFYYILAQSGLYL